MNLHVNLALHSIQLALFFIYKTELGGNTVFYIIMRIVNNTKVWTVLKVDV